MTDELSRLNRRLDALEAKLESRDMRTTFGLTNRMENWEVVFDNLNKSMSKMMQDIASLMTDSRYVELFTGQEIRDWYMATDLTSKDVHEILAVHFPDKVDLSIRTVGNYLKGECPDVHMRSFLGKLLRNEANKKHQEPNPDNTKS